MLSIPISIVSLKYRAIIEYHNDPGVEQFQLVRSVHGSSDGQRLSRTFAWSRMEQADLACSMKKCHFLWLPQACH